MADRIVQLIDKDNNNIYPIASVANGANITMTDIDPGEGSALSAGNYVAVYGGSLPIFDYSTTETDTGAKWIDGKAIYKKTIVVGTITANTLKTVNAGITNFGTLVKFEGVSAGTNGSSTAPFPQNYSGVSDMYSGNAVAARYNISQDTIAVWSNGFENQNIIVTLYYTKAT